MLREVWCRCLAGRRSLLALALAIPSATFSIQFISTPGHAACTPAAADGVTAICTGDTVDQDPDNGYGDGEDNVDLTIAEGATVTGTRRGVELRNDITFRNFGSVTGGTDEALEFNSGIFIANYGQMTAAIRDAISAQTIQSFLNAGTIIGGDSGVYAEDDVGSFFNLAGALIQGGDDGAFLEGNVTRLENAGQIIGVNAGVEVREAIGTLLNLEGALIRGGDEGVELGGNVTSFSNAGSIVGGDEGILTDSGFASLYNAGLIQGGTHAIRDHGTNVSNLHLLAGSILIGRVDFDNGTNRVSVGRGLSLNSTFESEGGASLAALGTADGHLVALIPVTGHGNDDVQIVAVDLSAFGGFEDALSALTSGYGGVVESRQAGLRSGQVNGFSAGDMDGTGLVSDSHVWVEGFGAFRHDESDRIGGDFDQLTGGLVAGMDRPLDDVTSIGAMVGFAASTSENEIDTQTNNATSFYAGIYGSTQSVGLAWDASLTVGYTDYEAERVTANNLVAGGLETARADFGGWFINPQVTATRAASNPWAGQSVHGFVAAPTLEQSLTLSYAGLFLDGYTETGTTNPLTLNDRSVHVASARAAIALPFERTEADGALTTLRLIGGLEARTQFGDDAVSGTLLGQAVRSTLDDDDFDAGAFLGLAGGYQTTSGLTAYAQAEAMLDTDLSYQISASAGLRITF